MENFENSGPIYSSEEEVEGNDIIIISILIKTKIKLGILNTFAFPGIIVCNVK